jgi:hypothetical protein
MSAYKEYRCEITNRDMLLQSLKELGFTPEVHATPQPMSGWNGETRSKKAEIIVRKSDIEQYNRSYNDIGFNWDEKAGQFTAILSDMDESPNLMGRIKQVYSKNVIEKALRDYRWGVNTSNVNVRNKKINKIEFVATKMV